MDILKDIVYILIDGLDIGLMFALYALGVFIAFRVLDFADLTAEASIVLGNAIVVRLIIAGVNVPLAILIATIGGFLAGIITGVLHTKLKIPSILSGIIVLTGLFPISLWILGSANVSLSGDKTIYSYLSNLFSNPSLNSILTTLIIVILVFLLLYWFFGTEVGVSLRATGDNQKMARAQGINTDSMIILGLAVANALIALSGALIAQSENNANLDMGRGTIVIGLAAIILGEAIFGKRSFKNYLISVILGSLTFYIMNGVAIEIGINHNALKLIQAILITFILSIPIIKKYFQKRKTNEVLTNGKS